MNKRLLFFLYAMGVILGGVLSGTGASALLYEISHPNKPHSCLVAPTAQVTERPLYQMAFITAALPAAQAAKERGHYLKVSEMISKAAIYSSFGYYPENPADCVVSILWMDYVTEFEKEVITAFNLTQYDNL